MPVITPNPFFAKSRSASEIKSEIFTRFFKAWYNSHFPTLQQDKALLYIDMLPDQVLPQEPEALPTAVASQKIAPSENPGIKAFVYAPAVAAAAALQENENPESLPLPYLPLQELENKEILAGLLSEQLPAFAMLNPFEYGFPNQLLHDSLLHSSADICLLFKADYLRKRLVLGKAGRAMRLLFGEDGLEALKDYFHMEPNTGKREKQFLGAFEKVFTTKGFLALTFKIGLPGTGRSDHFLVYATKDKAAYKTAKALLLPYTDFLADGVPVFGANQHHLQQVLLFPELNLFSVVNLMQDLLAKASVFNYKSIEKIADEHSLATPYIPENYQQAFERLRDLGKVMIINHKTMQPVKKSTPGSLIKFTSLSA